MRRREFLKAVAGSLFLAGPGAFAAQPDDIKITRAVGFDLVSDRPKLVGKNSRRDVHGRRATDRMVRLYTNAGIEGIGNCRAEQAAVAQLLGKNPFELYRRAEKKVSGPLGVGTMPVWDLIGKVLNKPVCQLLGGAGAEQVPVYDGSIYFSDLLAEYAEKPLDRFKEEIDMGLALGHRAFKVKIGRGAKWMSPEAGYARDIEVLKTIRRHAGRGIVIGVDANNGYDPAKTERLLQDLPDYNFAFLEEMFPEEVQKCLALKRFISRHGWKTLVADGETQGNLDAYKPFIEARAIDIFQGDMNRFGFEGILTEAAWCKVQGLQVAPHNWGSLVGFYMQLHVGRAITNLYRAEHDPLSNNILIAEGYRIRDGYATVPDSPGFGLKINEKNFAAHARVRFDLTL
ncbi:MAG: mandelate racemase/muconate lactonizing enzyme family protein [Phycisphaerales bacterium]|nr:MAG: mandelate racemase/muconate lactonizing enzyme family protein [Phycisphaerales bacterium]